MPDPILLIPWTRDFVADLKDYLVERRRTARGVDFRNLLLIFPHTRPSMYLDQALRDDAQVCKPLLLPESIAVDNFLPGLRARHEGRPLRRVDTLDQVALLQEVVFGLRDRGGLPAGLPDDRRAFFPWGMRLAGLFEELFRHDREPEGLHMVEDEVLPWAAALLERLGDIGQAYKAALDERGWTTTGLDTLWAAHNLDLVAQSLRGREVVLAGFHALSGAQETVFRHLWEEGLATVLWHSDPDLAAGRPGHFAASEHRDWRDRWQAPVHVLGYAGQDRVRDDKFSFHEGYDLHSQLGAMREEMDRMGLDATVDSAAVIAPDPSMLMPVLHTLPSKDVNISMGFPFARSSLNRLLDLILRLQENRQDGPDGPGGRYHWRDLVNLIRHPYLKMLRVGASADAETSLRAPLRGLEMAIRHAGRFIEPFTLEIPDEAIPDGATREETEEALQTLLATTITAFADADTLAGLGEALDGLGRLLLGHDDSFTLWSRFPLDGECLHRMLENIVPTLVNTSLGQERLSRNVLFAILREQLKAERIPFEAYPLSGLQVMGFLETRLLRFRTLFILGATESNLPGTEAYDPLLPDPLRHLLGLPDSRQRDIVAAYNFYRLVNCADRVLVFYATGSSGTGLFEDKSVRSRFVEQLIFDREKSLGRLLQKDEPPVHSVSFRIRSIPRKDGLVPKSDALLERLHGLLETSALSPSFFDGYLRCPARFYYERLTVLRPVEEVSEDGDPAGLGTVVHETLRGFFAQRLDQDLDPAALDAAELEDLFLHKLQMAEFFAHMDFDRRLMVAAVGRARLRNYLRAMPPTRVVALERKLSGELDLAGRVIRVTGYADRLDRRDGRALLLDYKTGRIERPDTDLWTDGELFDGLGAYGIAPDSSDPSLLDTLAERLKSLQLPLYLLMHGDCLDGAWVDLADTGREVPLFHRDAAQDDKIAAVRTRTPAILEFLLRHMTGGPHFVPRPSKRCEWCPYASICGR